MMGRFAGALFLLSVVGAAHSASLPMPSYITPCSRHEPNMNACALKNARAAIPKFMNGDRKYKIPKLDPISITQLRVNEGVLGLNLTINQAKMFGLRQAVLEKVDVNFDKKVTSYQIFIPRAEISCDYEIQGRILILPITGAGPGNITLLNVNLTYTYDFELVKRKDGLTYFLPKDSKLDFDTSRIYVRLENLFNGNKLLGEQMNVFIDDNWRDLKQDIGPIIAEAISETMRRILFNIFELVDYDQAFPDIPVVKSKY